MEKVIAIGLFREIRGSIVGVIINKHFLTTILDLISAFNWIAKCH